jgi:hypothetical protein
VAIQSYHQSRKNLTEKNPFVKDHYKMEREESIAVDSVASSSRPSDDTMINDSEFFLDHSKSFEDASSILGAERRKRTDKNGVIPDIGRYLNILVGMPS